MPRTLTPVVLLLLGLSASAAHAERADRLLPMVVESDGKQAALVDLARKITVLNGNATVTQGTLLIRADRVEVREDPPGRYVAQTKGAAGQQVLFKQKRDRVDEVIEAQADRVDYDSAAELVRFIGNAKLHVLRAGVVGDQASAAVITYDQKADTLVFEGSAPGNTQPASAPNNGRARLVFLPRSDAASEPARAGSGAAR